MDKIQKIGAPSIQSENEKLQKPMANHSFKKEELDWPTIHTRLAHTSEGKLKKMRKEETIKDLPKIHSSSYNYSKTVYHICIRNSITSLPKE